MSEKDLLMDLEEPLRRLTSGINSIELMTYGLARVKDPYADGLYAIWDYLRSAEADVREVVERLKTTGE